MHSNTKFAFGVAALAAVMSVAASASATPNAIQSALSQPIKLARVQGEGMHGLNGDYSIFVPASSMAQPKGYAQTNFYIKDMGSIYADPNAIQYTPANIRSAYSVPLIQAPGPVVIVDAFDDPFAKADFDFYVNTFPLPVQGSKPTAGTELLQVIYATGVKPPFNSGWSQEEALDVEMGHAVCPFSKIILIEAASNSFADLGQADDLAATIPGAHVCSNSWGAGEFSGDSAFDHYYQHAGMTYFFSSGDTGGQREYPAASQFVVAVGGTHLLLDAQGHRSSESAWSGAGCGPSAFTGRPAFQNGIAGIVGGARGISDISAVADPNTGVLVRWNGGWFIFGGTSVACPIVASIANVAGTNRGSGPAQNTAIYSHLGDGSKLFDCTGGSAGGFPGVAGWDYPTGCGSPIGIGAF